MTTCKDIYAFLSQVSARNVTALLSDADDGIALSTQPSAVLPPGHNQKAQADVQALGADQAAFAQESSQRAAHVEMAQDEERKTHSILFHFEGKDKQAAELQRETQVESSLKSVDR